MERKLSKRSLTLKPSPIQELSHLAQRCNAINLAEGFPDFPAPSELKDAAIAAIRADFNQYRHVQGLCDYLAQTMKLNHGLDVDPVKNIAICCGQSEAFAATILSVVDEGDEVLLLDPAYETYDACITMAGGIPVYVALNPPHWTLEIEELMAAFTPRTKAIVLNSPHNPTGKVFSRNELMVIAEMCCRMDCLAITDEVYEHITFDSEHITLASLPGMLERTIITSSMSKTYSVTGWRVGWAVAPFEIASSIRNIHEYMERRDYIVDLLNAIGFKVHFKPQGAVFVFAELPQTCAISDVEYVSELIKVAGVAAVPGCGFFHAKGKSSKQDCSQSNVGPFHSLESVGSCETSCTTKDYRNSYIRFAYCKSKATLLAAAEKLHKYNEKLGLHMM
ncbi:hypothetical protein KI387_010656 [Taxus chinensis]|uniref:Aminotransferase class I/classII large domain-containing protein n=1 Tax=Taxus chinensis TaxID=29808 RepID=A0AA38FLF4_TAXCH|nr:hypothetical protein KI387_010656 [Taxus chinensis]